MRVRVRVRVRVRLRVRVRANLPNSSVVRKPATSFSSTVGIE